MKHRLARRTICHLASVTLVIVCLSLTGCVRRERTPRANDQHPQISISQTAPLRININTASSKELASLPGIGEGYAARIIEYREKYGPFRRPEHLIMVRGISEKRYRRLQELISV